jgi:transcriptional regulator GlxA family with amidase domain
MPRKRIGFLVFPGIQGLDLVGPMDAFAAAQIGDGQSAPGPAYDVLTIGLGTGTIAAASGLVLKPRYSMENAPPMDTLVVPGGQGMRDPKIIANAAPWIRKRARATRRIAAVCTGVFGPAATGLLAGRRVTTHWRYAPDIAKRFPDIRVEPDAIYVKDGPFYTSAGITAGIDLALALIEEDFGPSVSLAVARDLVVYLRRSGGQAQFSEPLRFETELPDRLADVAAWIATNFDKPLTVESLAARAHLCPRQFSRRFKHAFGRTPGAFVEQARLSEAQRRLAESPHSIERVANSVGYSSPHVFRRAFERNFGVSPALWRNRFGPAAKQESP